MTYKSWGRRLQIFFRGHHEVLRYNKDISSYENMLIFDYQIFFLNKSKMCSFTDE